MVSSGIEYNPASDIHAKIETMYSILGYVLKFCTTVQNEALFHVLKFGSQSCRKVRWKPLKGR